MGRRFFRALLAGAGIWTGLGALGFWLLAGGAPAPAFPATGSAASSAPQAPRLAAPLAAAVADEPALSRPVVLYPDGSEAGLLNGVAEPMVIRWPDRLPFTPIVGTFRDGPPNFWDWYVHADGTQSTVAMFRLHPGAAPIPTSLVRHPKAIGPVRAVGDGRFVSKER